MNKSLKILLAFILLSISGRAYTQVDTIVWQQLSPLPDGLSRINSAYFQIDSDFYVAGGDSANAFASISAVWKYHIPTDNWTQMNNLPFGPASTTSSLVLNGKGYFFVEWDLMNYRCDTMLWQYDPSADSWVRLLDAPDNPRYNSSSFSYDGMGYIGFTGLCNGISDNHLWQYNPQLNQWTQMATYSGIKACGRGTALSHSGLAYFFGGYDSSNNFIGDVIRYNVINNTWDSICQIPGNPRWGSVFWSFDSVIIGGGGSDGINLHDDFYSYNISQNIWTPIAFKNSFGSTEDGASFIFYKIGYYFGGVSTGSGPGINSNNLWSFDASRFFPPDTPTGIASLKNTTNFSLYPNPASQEQGFSVSTSESGDISFYDALGRLLDEHKLQRGIIQIKLSTDNEVVFYKASLSTGETKYGKLILLK